MSRKKFMADFGLKYPLVLAPMAGAMDWELAAAVSEVGGLGSLPAAMLTPDQLREQCGHIRERTPNPINLNFFCHQPPVPDNARMAQWHDRLRPYYKEQGLDADAPVKTANRAPFDAALCAVVEEIRPKVVSFHFGLPEDALLSRVRAAGCKIFSSATTVAEARWLAERGVDAVIAQGFEAGGHRGMFLSDDVTRQPGSFALIPQIVDAVRVPVIATGGITDARGIAAAFVLGASAVQLGTAYLFSPEAKISALHRAALAEAHDDSTVLTNVFTGRPARGIVNRAIAELGPIGKDVPAFPLAATGIGPLRAAAEKKGISDFSPLWAGQAVALGHHATAADITRNLMAEAEALLRDLSRDS